MHTNITPLYPQSRTPVRVPMHVKLIVLLLALVVPLHVIGTDPTAPYEQEFLITMYYSPLPGQCCYVKGGYEADKYLNGEGHTAADGTSVYPGMLAAPPGYDFGTVVNLPDIGTLKIHDRGGAIQVLGDGTHRLDIWAGHGEEGLARALAFGLQRVKGTVYPNGSSQPAVAIDFESLPAPVAHLEDYLIWGKNLVAMRAKLGDRGLSPQILQEYLQQLGYFTQRPTGFFGPETQTSLSNFLRDYHVGEPDDILSERTGAHVLAATKRSGVEAPVSGHVDATAKPQVVREAQRILRSLGYYRGRTNGVYNDTLSGAILSFQQDNWIVSSAEDPGAGRIGPQTQQALKGAWDRMLVSQRADRYLILHRVDAALREQGRQLESFLEVGNYGDHVRTLQTLLAKRGHFPAEEINGSFGPLTEEAVMAYQLSAGIIRSQWSKGAGVVGPATLKALQKEERIEAYRLVRAEGWDAL